MLIAISIIYQCFDLRETIKILIYSLIKLKASWLECNYLKESDMSGPKVLTYFKQLIDENRFIHFKLFDQKNYIKGNNSLFFKKGTFFLSRDQISIEICLKSCSLSLLIFIQLLNGVEAYIN